MPAKREISLLPDEHSPQSVSSKIILWLTTVGRFVIVFTELIVIIAFLSRFWLDRRNSDLSEVIRMQKAILESTGQFENDFASLQNRLKLIADLTEKNQRLGSKIASLSSSTPPDIAFDHLTLNLKDNNYVTSLTASAYSEESIVNFITNLTLNSHVSAVDVRKIEKKQKEAKYTIDIVLTLKKDS